ncbi:MAG: hypothetical protein HC846_02455 [Blastocatellia bacterium]|nr:hypothetical protein [Blastocatellia bacterium]
MRGSIKPLDAELRKNFIAPVEFIYRNLAALLIDEGRISEAQQVLSLLKEEEFYQFTQRSPDAASSAIKNIELTAEETSAANKYKDLTDKIMTIVTRSTQLELERRGQTLSPEN